MPAWLPLLLGFLTAIGPLSTDMYLPAFPSIEADFGAPHGSAELTLAAWFLGLAVGQLVQGTLGDRLGRRRPLIAGLLVYLAGSIGCALATDIQSLALFRCIAAFGGSASMVLPRAIVRDLADGHAAARLMSRLMLVMGAAPILAPGLGGLMIGLGGWRPIFWFSSAYAVLSALLVWRLLPETLAPERRLRLGLGAQLLRYLQILREPNFLAHVAMGCAGMFLMFTYVGGSAAVFVGMFRLDPTTFGLVFGLNAAGFILASQFNPMLLLRLGPQRLVRLAGLLILLSAGALVLLAFTSPGHWAVLMGPIFVAVSASAFVLPNAAVGALSRHASQAGSASALMGTLQFTVAGSSGVLLSQFADGTARPMALLMLAGALGVVVAERLRPRR
ncbi:multidrug effflux MFS transporter [Pseudoroseomonas cervicalis]|uniref:multidrug effflux MFS transporter n=1 Tax=Teichococcus cervicalis TaxID=204525 RepID=UPI0022F1CCAE|nr:multidrug effflux MFS transporter [Pseudoroseomonas cervicalis]WBV42504.1 multidrug effflux MFS transporter [Pseudoroseomonas cervicalis]